jgi:hypothetical protein
MDRSGPASSGGYRPPSQGGHRPGESGFRPAYDDRPTQAMPATPRAPERDITAARAEAPPTRASKPAQPAVTQKAPVQVRRLRRGRLAIRKISPWSTLRFSLVFYFCMLLIVLLAAAIIFATMKAFGIIDNVEKTLRESGYDVVLSGGGVFRWLFLLGLVGTIVASAITVFMAFLYNLIADVVGGIEMLVTERE